MRGVVGHSAKNVVIAFVIAAIMAQYPIVLAIHVTGIRSLGQRTLEVRGIVELHRGSDVWTGPENFSFFSEWWQSEAAAERVSSDSRGMITLHSITWTLVESKANSDVLRFRAVVTVNPAASPPWHKGWPNGWNDGQHNGWQT
jgi:hypothetical protein